MRMSERRAAESYPAALIQSRHGRRRPTIHEVLSDKPNLRPTKFVDGTPSRTMTRESWKSLVRPPSFRRLLQLGPVGDGGLVETEDALALFAFQRQAWGADPFGAEAGHGLADLDVLDELHMRVQVQGRREPAVDRTGFV